MPLPFRKKSIKSLAGPASAGKETTIGTQDQPGASRASVNAASSHGSDTDLPLPVLKKGRRPSCLSRKSGANAESPAPRNPAVIARCAEQQRSKATMFSRSFERENINSNRISNTSDLPPSPRTSLDLSPQSDGQEGTIQLSLKFRDSGLGQDMGESNLHMKELNDIVQVYKENIDDHTEKLMTHLHERKEELMCQLDNYLMKRSRDIRDGMSDNQKVEFHPQHDLDIGIITFTDEANEKRAIQAMDPHSLPAPIYENVSHENVPNQDRKSIASDDSEDYEYVPDECELDEALTKSFSEPCHASSPSYLNVSNSVPHKFQKQNSTPGYINMEKKKLSKRPMPLPKPDFRKK